MNLAAFGWTASRPTERGGYGNRDLAQYVQCEARAILHLGLGFSTITLIGTRASEIWRTRMTTVSLVVAQTKLAELIHGLAPGDELVITENDQPVAKLVAPKSDTEAPRKPRQPGTLRGTVLYMAPDFDAPLEDFKEYME
jgi:antitoxin (DNA-binding transcriptional repressor) of toxin-antitoxin stability system